MRFLKKLQVILLVFATFAYFSCDELLTDPELGGGGSSSSDDSGSGSGGSGGSSDSGSSEGGSGSGGGSDSGSGSGDTEPSSQDVSNSWKNSAEITKFGTTINTGAAKNLYTITINYPQGDYVGTSTTSFSLKGSGSTRNANILYSVNTKGVPSGTLNWNGMYVSRTLPANQCAKGHIWKQSDGDTCPECGGARANQGAYEFKDAVDGNYWFTDETNKIKYYVTDLAKAGIHVTLNNSYWNEIKSILLNNSSMSGVNLLAKERADFGSMREYNKDNTEYFYVIFDDFGPSKASVSSYSIGGTVGCYSSEHIRPGETSNNADVFYVNSRWTEGYSEVYGNRSDKTAARKEAVDKMINTLIHEYMHYLMDAHHLLEAEEEYGGNIYDAKGQVSGTSYPEMYSKMYSASLTGSLFWIEGCANYAPYKVVKSADTSAVSSWLGAMNSWRPDLNGYYTRQTNGGDGYPVYGAGGLFMSYIAEKYGQDTINKFHKWRDKGSDVYNVIKNEYDPGNAAYKYVGNLNTISMGILNKNFKDVYLNFLMQCMSSLDSNVCMKDCVENFQCPADWGFTQGVLDSAINSNRFNVTNALTGYSGSNLPELSFVINRWTQIPEKLTLTGDNVKCYAIWF